MKMLWFRFYSEFLDDTKVGTMSESDQLLWVKLLCMASESKKRGRILETDEQICWRIRISPETLRHALDKFRAKGMIEHYEGGYRITHWDDRQHESDNSTSRVRKYREKKRTETKEKRLRNVSVTPPEEDTEKETDPDLEKESTNSSSTASSSRESKNETPIQEAAAVKTDRFFGNPHQRVVYLNPPKPRWDANAPWPDDSQRKEFEAWLVKKYSASSSINNPAKYAERIVRATAEGEAHVEWDEFKSGVSTPARISLAELDRVNWAEYPERDRWLAELSEVGPRLFVKLPDGRLDQAKCRFRDWAHQQELVNYEAI